MAYRIGRHGLYPVGALKVFFSELREGPLTAGAVRRLSDSSSAAWR